MKILIATKHFDYLSGAPLYVYELSRVLAKRGHEVTVAASAIGGEMAYRAQRAEIAVVRIGDSRFAARSFDILHLQQPEIVKEVLRIIPDVPAVQTCHSEWPIEDPVIDPRIRHYIAIRPSIADRIEKKVPSSLKIPISVVWNGVDMTRFNPQETIDDRFALWVGTVDGLRREAGMDFAKRASAEGLLTIFIGKRFMNWASEIEGAIWRPESWNIETEVKACTYTGGILIGRTTIEGWACGKSSRVYDINLDGRVKSMNVMAPPGGEEMAKFDIEVMTNKIEAIYGNLLGKVS